MPGLVDVAWFIYKNSGPALQLSFLAIVVLGWQYEVDPRLTALEQTQSTHDERLDEKALGATERDALLENAHERLDQADSVRHALRDRLTKIEHEMIRKHDDVDLDAGYRRDGGEPPDSPSPGEAD